MDPRQILDGGTKCLGPRDGPCAVFSVWNDDLKARARRAPVPAAVTDTWLSE